MSTLAFGIGYLAIAGALASWVAGAIFYVQTMQAADANVRWGLVFAWMFNARRLQGAAAEQAAKVNKAIVAFIVCIIVAATAFALATNLARGAL